MLVLISLHVVYLKRATEWFNRPPADRTMDDLPTGFGAWRRVFTALRQAEKREEQQREELAKTLARFTEASSALTDGIILLDHADKIEWCNPMACQHFELNAERDRGFFISNLLRRPAFTEYLLRGDFSKPLEMNDPARSLTLSIQMLPFQERRRIIVSRDISQLMSIERMRQDFIANVSHELRTPLTVVSGFLEHFIDSDTIDSGKRRTIEELMLAQTMRMRRLIDDLLTLSKLETQGEPPSDEVIDLAQLTRAMIDEAGALSDGKHRIETGNIEAIAIRGSPDELRSAFSNLVSNAVRYTPIGGRIVIGLVREGDVLRFSVQDSGLGIPAEHIPRVTERFYRVDKSRSRETGGTGLGLAIAKHILVRHGGRLDIESQVGKGSTFHAVLPAMRIDTREQVGLSTPA
ncbi:MAG: phosphate regulon sensor histidine kinase PhoR [Betaproteobacteria bacterium]|nr:phosphate regulon sensor histidine kinase PhoR [Betaproteobacteria bacterium]